MNRNKDKHLVVGLDVGTSKIAAIVGQVGADGTVEVVGMGSAPAHGLKRGVVVDIESTVQAMQRAIQEAEFMAQCEITAVHASIAGNHLRSSNSHGVVAIRDHEVSAQDVERVLDAARALKIPADQRIFHVLPQEYVIDDQEGIRQPIGMSGVRLEARVHLVVGAVSAAQNITKCIQKVGLELDELVIQQVASSKAVLGNDEKDLGVCLVDIGAGTTDIAVFCQGAIRHTAVLPIAGDQVTNDIAIALRTPQPHAEELKVKYACALRQLTSSEETIQVPSVGDRPPRRLQRQTLAEVVQPRYEELFSLIQNELRRSGFEELIAGGIVLTGGGAKMEGVIDLAEEIFQMPVRLGLPTGVAGLSEIVSNPVHAAGVGLLLNAASGERAYVPTPGRRAAPMPAFGGLFQRTLAWVRGEL